MKLGRPLYFYDHSDSGTQPPPESDPEPEPTTQPDQPETKEDDEIPEDSYKVVAKKYKEAKAELERLQAEKKKREESELEKKQEWETLAENRAKELEAATTENLRLRVALAKNIPVEFVDRLQGQTLEEIEKDAEKIIPLLAPTEPRPSSIPVLKPSGQSNEIDVKNMTPAEIREKRKAGKLPLK